MVHEGNGAIPWRAPGFYGQPDTGKRHISWDLLKSLKNQCDLPWVVFGDFNEITHLDEKLGWMDREAKQMEDFRNCLHLCGLNDLGFVGQMWTRDNGCKEVIEAAWDPLRADPDFQIQDRIKNCQSQLQRWNQNGFGNVNKVLK